MSSYSPAGVHSTGMPIDISLWLVEIDPWLARAAARRPEAVALETPDAAADLPRAADGGHARRRPARAARRRAGRPRRADAARRGATSSSPSTPACCCARPPCRSTRGSARASARSSLRGAEVVVSTPLAEDGGAPFSVREPDEDEVALVVHTSGTTRAPRPVELTFGNLAAHIRAAGAVLGTDPDERWLCPMPLSHVGGLMILARSAAAAGTVVLEPPSTPTAPRGSCARATSRSSRSSRRCSRASSTPAAAPARGCGACCSAAARCRRR